MERKSTSAVHSLSILISARAFKGRTVTTAVCLRALPKHHCCIPYDLKQMNNHAESYLKYFVIEMVSIDIVHILCSCFDVPLIILCQL